jgi:hypothetical protein
VGLRARAAKITRERIFCLIGVHSLSFPIIDPQFLNDVADGSHIRLPEPI